MSAFINVFMKVVYYIARLLPRWPCLKTLIPESSFYIYKKYSVLFQFFCGEYSRGGDICFRVYSRKMASLTLEVFESEMFIPARSVLPGPSFRWLTLFFKRKKATLS
jgi:hypothetical protein